MSLRPQSILAPIGALGLMLGSLYVIVHNPLIPRMSPSPAMTATTQTANVIIPLSTPSYSTKPIPPQSPREISAPAHTPMTTTETPLVSPNALSTTVEQAVVNIVCMPRAGSTFSAISGSGVMIDARGIILTNAHVAQYVLISEIPSARLSCSIRSGSPARPIGGVDVLYIPPVWVAQHSGEINQTYTLGTGEHDYAFLYMNTRSNIALPTLSLDTHTDPTTIGQPVVVSSYPVQALTTTIADTRLFPLSHIGSIATLLTLQESTVDVISVKTSSETSRGSSGGAITNAQGNLVGLITTMSGYNGSISSLYGITLSYINRDLLTQTGTGIVAFVSSDLVAQEAYFRAYTAPSLWAQYEAFITQ